MTGPVLWHIRFSHFNEKARWALDYKQVPHRRRSVAPGLHSRRSRKLGGRGTMPVLVTDGRAIGDSAEIVAELERSHPDPPLYPTAAPDREAALELERRLGEELGPGLRSAVFAAILPHRDVTVAVMTQGFGRGRRILTNAIYPLVHRAAVRGLPADEAAAERGRAQTVAALELIEERLDGGDYLVGDRFSVADLTAAALLCPLVAPPEFPYEMPDAWPNEWERFRRSLAERRGYRWVREMFSRHRGRSAAVSDD